MTFKQSSMTFPQSITKKSTHLKRFLVLTLSRADETPERLSLDRNDILLRIKAAMQCTSIIVTKEQHGDTRHNFYVGILIEEGAPRRSTRTLMRKIFPEFGGVQLNVSFKRTWATVCEYVLKESKDPIPLVWGMNSLENIRDIVKAKVQHRASPMKGSAIPRKLKDVDGRSQAYDNTLKAIFKDLIIRYSPKKEWNISLILLTYLLLFLTYLLPYYGAPNAQNGNSLITLELRTWLKLIILTHLLLPRNMNSDYLAVPTRISLTRNILLSLLTTRPLATNTDSTAYEELTSKA